MPRKDGREQVPKRSQHFIGRAQCVVRIKGVLQQMALFDACLERGDPWETSKLRAMDSEYVLQAL